MLFFYQEKDYVSGNQQLGKICSLIWWYIICLVWYDAILIIMAVLKKQRF